MSPFEIKDCALLIQMSGLPPAVNLRELRERIAVCSPNVLYHHFCDTQLGPSTDYPDYRNDFAIWARRRLGDQIVAERLGMIDPYVFPSMEELRQVTLDIIDERLSEVFMVPWARPGHEFYCMQAVTVVFDTGKRVSRPDELAPAISLMTNGSIYFHVLEARKRNPAGVNDFSAWIQGLEGDWEKFVKAIREIDVTFHTLAEIRGELVEAVSVS
jgi:hypothetical protein